MMPGVLICAAGSCVRSLQTVFDHISWYRIIRKIPDRSSSVQISVKFICTSLHFIQWVMLEGFQRDQIRLLHILFFHGAEPDSETLTVLPSVKQRLRKI